MLDCCLKLAAEAGGWRDRPNREPKATRDLLCRSQDHLTVGTVHEVQLDPDRFVIQQRAQDESINHVFHLATCHPHCDSHGGGLLGLTRGKWAGARSIRGPAHCCENSNRNLAGGRHPLPNPPPARGRGPTPSLATLVFMPQW